MDLKTLFSILNSVLESRVFYSSNIYDNGDNASMPYIVYQEVTKRPIGYSDDAPISYKSNVQITLVTKSKNQKLENKLESAFRNNNLNYSMINESHNSDKSINRVYEIQMEEF